MGEVKTSQDVGYTTNGESGKQCKDCKHLQAIDDNYGNCFGHRVATSGSCNNFTAK